MNENVPAAEASAILLPAPLPSHAPTSGDESVQAAARRTVAPALALAVGGPALIWAGMNLNGTTRVKFALAGIGALLMVAGLPQLAAEARRLRW